jgi:hypothetical protein
MEEAVDLRTLIPEGMVQVKTRDCTLIRCDLHNDNGPSRAVYPDHSYCFGGCAPTDRWLGYFATYKLLTGRKYGGPVPDFKEITRTARTIYVPENESEIPGELLYGQYPLRSVLYYHERLLTDLAPHQSFLVKRGLTLSTIKEAKLGHDGYSFTIPVFDRTGEGILTLRHRRDDRVCGQLRDKYWGTSGCNGVFLYGLNHISEGTSALMVEGELDAILVTQLRDVLGTYGLSLTDGVGAFNPRNLALYVPLFRQLGRLVLLLDDDKAAALVWREGARFLKGQGVNVFYARFPRGSGCKDVTEFYVRNGAEALLSVLRKAAIYE